MHLSMRAKTDKTICSSYRISNAFTSYFCVRFDVSAQTHANSTCPNALCNDKKKITRVMSVVKIDWCCAKESMAIDNWKSSEKNINVQRHANYVSVHLCWSCRKIVRQTSTTGSCDTQNNFIRKSNHSILWQWFFITFLQQSKTKQNTQKKHFKSGKEKIYVILVRVDV